MKRWISSTSLIALTILLTFLTSGAAAAPEQKAANRVKVFIGFTHQPGPAEMALVRSRGGAIKYTYQIVPSIAATIPEAAIPGLLHNPHVTRIEPDGVVHLLDAELDNAWGVKHIGAGVAHDTGNKGTGVKVGILDTGIDTDHQDLVYDPSCSYDFRNNDPIPEDGHSHGTHVAGTIAGLDNESGVVGVAPEVTLCIYKVFDDAGNADWSDITAAVQQAALDGVQVTNNSYGDSSAPATLEDALNESYYNYGVLHFAGAGNNSFWTFTGPCIYPALWSSVIAVGATNSNNARDLMSSVCPEMELAAPGTNIYSTWNNGSYGNKSGTSMASPHAAGTAALVIAAGMADSNGNGWINDEVRQRLIDTADDLGSVGHDTSFGYGLVDADEASQLNLTPPAAPSGLVATAVSESQIDLIWNDHSGDETGFEIERSPDGSTGWINITTTGPNVSSYSNIGLTANTTYHYRVRAVNTVGPSPFSNIDSATTLAPPPAAPTGLVATAVSDSQIDLIWNDNSSDETGFEVERSPDGSSWSLHGTTVPNAPNYSDTGLTPGTIYYYRVRALNAIGPSGFSNTDSATTLAPPPAAPTGLVATAVSDSQIDLIWNDNSSDEDGFKIERSLDGSTGWTQIATLGANVTGYSDTGLMPETTYWYRLQAFNQVGDSPYSNEASASTLAQPVSVDDLAIADIFGAGAVSGSYQDTWDVDGQAQAIAERHSGGKPANRYSYLEHAWEFSVTGGGVTTFLATAWASATSDGDSFTFAYSVDGTTYHPMFTVSDTTAGEYVFSLPPGAQGLLTIRVTDTDQTPGNHSADTIFIDRLLIRSESGAGSLPIAPSSLVATATSASQIDLNWVDNASDEYGFEIQRSVDGQNWSTIDTVGANGTSFSDLDLAPSTTYYYHVQAFNGTGSSAPSNMASATTEAAPEQGQVHIGDLDGSGSPGKRNRWDATVTIIVHDENHDPVAGTTVTGSWSGAVSGTDTCVTDGGGRCQVTRSNIKNSAGNAAFSVTAAESSNYTYSPIANHDPDGDSDGTTITVAM